VSGWKIAQVRSGYFADPDGTPWEVAYVPALPLDEKGMIRW
jgi:hypothetical protein